MKNLCFLSILLMLSSTTKIWGQEATSFIQSAPIAVSAEGDHGEMGEDAETMRARAELSASQIKPEVENKTEVVAEVPAEIPAEVVDKKTRQNFSMPTLSTRGQHKYFQVSYHFLKSNWSGINEDLKDNSSMTSLSLVQKFHEKISIAIGLDFVHPKEEKMTPEEIRLFQLHIRPEYTWLKRDQIELFSSLGLGVNDYNIRKKISSTGSVDTYKTFGSGTSFSLTPATGVKWNLSSATSVDLNFLYAQYFGSLAKDFGGLGAGLRLQFKL